MATQVSVCAGAPPCFRVDETGQGERLDERLFPALGTLPQRAASLSPASLDEEESCRKVGSRHVNMTVQRKDGTTRPMEPHEREMLYLNRWFSRLRKQAHAVCASDVGNWECCALCTNYVTPVYLANPHVHAQGDGQLEGPGDCASFVCIACLLRSAFWQRWSKKTPECPFCRAEFDEDTLVPLRLTQKGE